jgi:hypothetical protein
MSSNDFPLNVQLKPLGYDTNPFTKRYVKKCKNGFERFIDSKTKKMKCFKECKSNQTRNKTTKRCQKKNNADTLAKTKKIRTSLYNTTKRKKNKTPKVSPSFGFDDIYSNISSFQGSRSKNKKKKTSSKSSPLFGMDEIYNSNSIFDGSNPKKNSPLVKVEDIYKDTSEFFGEKPNKIIVGFRKKRARK